MGISISDPFNNGGDWNPLDGDGGPVDGAGNSLGTFFGFGVQDGGVSLNDQLAEQGANKRTKLYTDFMANAKLDDISRSEINHMFDSGVSQAEISQKITDATEGKGIYASRLFNQSIANTVKDMPGRQQLSPAAVGSVL